MAHHLLCRPKGLWRGVGEPGFKGTVAFRQPFDRRRPMKLRVSAWTTNATQTKQKWLIRCKNSKGLRVALGQRGEGGKRLARAGLLCMVRQARPAPCHRLRCHCRAHGCVRACRIFRAGHRWPCARPEQRLQGCWTSWSPSNSRKPQLSGLQLLSPAAGCLRARLQVHEAAAVDGRQQPARCTSCCCIAARTVASKLAHRSQ